MPKKMKKTSVVSDPAANKVTSKFFLLISLTLVGIAIAQLFFFQSTLRIGLNLELTGDRSAVGQSSLKGAQLAIDQLNAQGGITHNNRKYRIELVTGDNRSDPQLASTVVQELKKKSVHVVIGPNASALAIPAATEAETQQLLMISPWSTSAETTLFKHSVFRTAFTDQIQMRALVKYVNFDLKATRVAVLYDETAEVLLEQAQLFRSEFESWGGQVVAYNAIPTDETTLTDQLTTLKRLNPQVIFLPVYDQQATQILTKAKELKLTSIFVGSDAWDAQQLVTQCGVNCDGTYVSAHFSAQTDNPKVQQFVTDFQNTYGQTPDDVAALSYDSVQLFAKAVSQATDLKSPDLAATLQTLQEFEGLTGNISYSTTSNDPFKSVQILKLENGQLNWVKTVYP